MLTEPISQQAADLLLQVACRFGFKQAALGLLPLIQSHFSDPFGVPLLHGFPFPFRPFQWPLPFDFPFFPVGLASASSMFTALGLVRPPSGSSSGGFRGFSFTASPWGAGSAARSALLRESPSLRSSRDRSSTNFTLWFIGVSPAFLAGLWWPSTGRVGLRLWLTGLPPTRADPLPLSYLLILPLFWMASFNFICLTSAFVAISLSSSLDSMAPAAGISS